MQERTAMRVAGEAAIRWRAGVTSFQMSMQMFVRTLLCAVGIWLASTIALVWYWTGYYFGAIAHQFFGRWLLSWVLGRVIPLYFLTLPYRGARYPIANIYDFLSQKIYYHSFPDWFWHYAPWGLIPTALLAGGTAFVFGPRTNKEGNHIRGIAIITPRRLNSRLRGDGIDVAGVRIPRALETEHFATEGKSGAGKSNFIRSLVRQIEAHGEIAIVLDSDREYVSEFYRPERGDVLLNPFDARCPRWTPWMELRPEYREADAETQAESLFPDPPRHADVGSTPFFRRSSRTLYVSLLQVASPQEPAVLPGLLNLPREQLRERLKATPAEALIDPGAHEQGAGIVATVANAVNPFRYLPHDARRDWSAREWAETREGWVFLTSEEATRAAVLPLLGLWLDSIVHRLLSTELNRSARDRIWIIADELPVLHRQRQIESLLARGRKRGLCVVIGFQAMSQLRAIYGRDEATTLLSCPSTKLIMRTDEPETAEWCSRQIGAREVSRDQIGATTGPRELRDGFSLQPRRTTEPAVSAGEIQKLEALTGYLCVAGHDRAKVKFRYLQPIKRQRDFIQRTDLGQVATSQIESGGKTENGATTSEGTARNDCIGAKPVSAGARAVNRALYDGRRM
jgi:hypothetical protein